MHEFEPIRQKLETGAGYVVRPLGIIEIKGASRLDLIDRMSTQKIRDLQPGTGAATVLTTEIGRTIDRLLMYADNERVMAVTGHDFADSIIGYLMRFVFFNDDFHMRNASKEFAAVCVYGQAAVDTLNALNLPTGMSLHHWQSAEVEGAELTVHRTDPVGGDGYLLLVPIANIDGVMAALESAGALEMTLPQFDYVRIASGLPLLGQELSLDYIPLETGLWDDVSFNKGCYTGQEIIARMESRGRLAKKMVKLKLAQPAEIGVAITANGREVGTLTSAVGEYGIGYIKTAVLENEKAEIFINGISAALVG